MTLSARRLPGEDSLAALIDVPMMTGKHCLVGDTEEGYREKRHPARHLL